MTKQNSDTSPGGSSSPVSSAQLGDGNWRPDEGARGIGVSSRTPPLELMNLRDVLRRLEGRVGRWKLGRHLEKLRLRRAPHERVLITEADYERLVASLAGHPGELDCPEETLAYTTHAKAVALLAKSPPSTRCSGRKRGRTATDQAAQVSEATGTASWFAVARQQRGRLGAHRKPPRGDRAARPHDP